MADGHLIWWLNQDDVERIEILGEAGALASWPAYLLEQFDSRNGRPGRGRLWVAEQLEQDNPPAPEGIPFDEDKPICRLAAECGGIVIRKSDYPEVSSLPGFVTNLSMELART